MEIAKNVLQPESFVKKYLNVKEGDVLKLIHIPQLNQFQYSIMDFFFDSRYLDSNGILWAYVKDINKILAEKHQTNFSLKEVVEFIVQMSREYIEADVNGRSRWFSLKLISFYSHPVLDDLDNDSAEEIEVAIQFTDVLFKAFLEYEQNIMKSD